MVEFKENISLIDYNYRCNSKIEYSGKFKYYIIEKLYHEFKFSMINLI